MSLDAVGPAARARGLLLVAALIASSGSAGCRESAMPGSAEAPADTAAGELEFRMAGPSGAAIVVPVYLNGQGPYDLILDTGATLTCLDSSVVTALSLPEQRGVLGSAVGVGGSGAVRLVQVDSLRVGPARVTDLLACTMDLQALRTVGDEVRGLLGLNVLRQFYVTLDFEREVLTLTQPAD